MVSCRRTNRAPVSSRYRLGEMVTSRALHRDKLHVSGLTLAAAKADACSPNVNAEQASARVRKRLLVIALRGYPSIAGGGVTTLPGDDVNALCRNAPSSNDGINIHVSQPGAASKAIPGPGQ